MKEISDKMKEDLSRVVCDCFTCSDRGNFARCYLNRYKDCTRYNVIKLLKDDNKNRDKRN